MICLFIGSLLCFVNWNRVQRAILVSNSVNRTDFVRFGRAKPTQNWRSGFTLKKVRHRLQLEFKIDPWTKKLLCLLPFGYSHLSNSHKRQNPISLSTLLPPPIAASVASSSSVGPCCPLVSSYYGFFFNFLFKFSSHQSIGLLKFHWCVVWTEIPIWLPFFLLFSQVVILRPC